MTITFRSDSDSSAAHLAKAEHDCWIVPDISSDVPIMPFRKIGVIGAGTMGGGIAMNFANAGLPVTIVETAQAALDRGLAVVRRNYDNSASRGRFSAEEVQARFARLTGSLSIEDLKDCDLIIEAVFEDMALKKSIFEKLDAVAKPGAILATNTSYLDVDQIAAATKRAESVVGMHFFSPANVMRLLEIVRGEKTSKSVVASALSVARAIGKIGVVVGVGPGFVGNRMLFQRASQAHQLIMEGAMPWDVDRVLREFGFRMGQFEMSDLAGLDIGWNQETSRGETLRDLLCEQDRRGQKTGAGYYDYDADRTARPSPFVERIIREFTARKGVTPRPISDQEILERLLYPMINEAAAILDEGKAIRPTDIDVVWVHGYRWPTATGGPMFWADQVGVGQIASSLEQFAGRTGLSALTPTTLVKRLSETGRKFSQLSA
ncbi:3-hydroxyacyl-CoA dehydrogenase [Bradyrhizobium sp. NAS80.1]|uniref:3-hydroxyacyl-CoA dehydrogenase n=1 Tax=Bradyrhizobium sp. NAS80.1 TaxID=1680159 RepID=UPI000A00DBA1|nr:3-hydroxyacyl-CoA dehydrogenase [Bradyrhizobium sp. NAS80.1]